MLCPKELHVPEQLVLVRREPLAGRFELVDGRDSLVRVERDVVRPTVVREAELAAKVGPCPLVPESIVEAGFEKQVLDVALAHILRRSVVDRLERIKDGGGVRHRVP
ncbi:hypothetical protein Hbl1158_02705 [Halobaculum sp. CBA1158]|uniref:hypothetical protein n=1 Tax=Halobaculum sp. CBA1158 TaxID=2904243 RepID=UPI001F3613BB|nr:hypothetical protein [Halobaculum sp. CBA1158]UIP00298.1 hypothetical protein Hbl1158_02705 [Halobaculum sp. CBA1158]